MKDVFRHEDPLTQDQRQDLDEFDRLWSCVATRTLSEIRAAMEASQLTNVTIHEFPHLGSNRFVGAQFELRSDGLHKSALGNHFYRTFTDLPVFFSEVTVRKPPG